MPDYRGPYNPRRPIPDGESSISIYGYVPSLALAIVALVTFGIALIVHLFYLVRKRGTRTFQFLLTFGSAMEIVGFGFRAASHSNPYVVISFILQYFMIVVAPVFLSAALYLSLSVAVQRNNVQHILPIRPKRMVAIFVVIDVVTIALQVLGAAFIGVSESAKARGNAPFIQTYSANDILLAGLAIQTFSFFVFLSITVRTASRNAKVGANREGKPEHTNEVDTTGSRRIPSLFFLVLGVSSFAIWTRTAFRLAETAEGVFGYASTHEWLFGILEYMPVIVALLVWAAYPLHKALRS